MYELCMVQVWETKAKVSFWRGFMHLLAIFQGYLGQVLSQQSGLSVLGLEGKASNVHSASCRNKQQSQTGMETAKLTPSLSVSINSMM